MPSSHIQRDAAGRAIHLLNETNEMPSREPRQSIASINAAYNSRHTTSYPNTPDLTRSDSYDSQASGHGSPLTPASNGGFNEPLFPVFPTKFMQSEHQPTLPPISALHAFAGALEPKTPTTPELSRRKSSFSYPYNMTAAAGSSSSLEDFHYRHNMESHDYHKRAAFLPDSGVHRSVETADDYPDQPLADQRQVAARASREEEEKPDSGRKGTKGAAIKNGTQKRYPCKEPTCDKSFTTSGHASRHAKIHEGSKPIPCTFEGCPKRFTRQDNMKQHLETHRREKSRASAKQARRPSLATRRQSASSRGSVSRFSTPRDTPPLLSPTLQAGSVLSPGLSPQGWNRPSVASRTPSGLDALAMVAATEHQQQEAQRKAESFVGAFWNVSPNSHRY